MPDKLKEMQDIFYAEAKKYDVLPLDNSTLARFLTPRPSATAGRTVFTYSGELTGVPPAGAPNILAKDFTITAEVEIPEGGAEGMIVTEGGRFGGYGLFLSKGEFGFGRGKVVFLYNLLDLKRTTWEGPELKAGKHTIVFDFKYDGPGFGKGGTGVLYRGRQGSGPEVHGAHDADHVPRRRDLRRRPGHPHRGRSARVSLRCPFKFTGKINKLTFNLGPAQHAEADPKQVAEAVARCETKRGSTNEKTADSGRRRRSGHGCGVAGRSVARWAVVAGCGTDRRRHTSRTRDRHRPDRIRGRLLAGHAAGRHVDLQRGRHAVSRLPRHPWRMGRAAVVAGGRGACCPDGAVGACMARRANDTMSLYTLKQEALVGKRNPPPGKRVQELPAIMGGQERIKGAIAVEGLFARDTVSTRHFFLSRMGRTRLSRQKRRRIL